MTPACVKLTNKTSQHTKYCQACDLCQALTRYWEYTVWSLMVPSPTTEMSSDHTVLTNKMKRRFKWEQSDDSGALAAGYQSPAPLTPFLPSRCQLLPSAREWNIGVPRKCSHKMHVAIMPSAMASSLHLVLFLSNRK